MKDFQQRKKVRRMAASRAAFLALIIVAVLLIRGAYGVFLKERETSQDLVKTKESLAAADARSQELTLSIETLKTEQGLEKEIRDRFSVAKSGEEIVLIIDPKVEEKLVQEEASLWIRIRDWFKNVF